jgi:succinate dehydrogenase/fumarate reductase flavoprotein subunit
LAGLTAAHAVLEAGGEPVIFERSDRPGGTTMLSSGWIWRYRDLATYQWGAPSGDSALQELVWDTLPDSIIWLERKGIRLLARGTANPITDGVRIDPRQTIDCLLEQLPPNSIVFERAVVSLALEDCGVTVGYLRRRPGVEEDFDRLTEHFDSVVLAGGGYAAARERLADDAQAPKGASSWWRDRHSGCSDGTTISAATAIGAQLSRDRGEFYARAVPTTEKLEDADFVRLTQLYAQHVTVLDGKGRVLEREPHDWADVRVIWQIGRTTGNGWYIVGREALDKETPYGTVRGAIINARDAGGEVLDARTAPLADALAERGVVLKRSTADLVDSAMFAVAVAPGVTHTIGGLAVDLLGTVRGTARVFAAGTDVGGIASGGYASGLAQALTLGRIAGTAATDS